MSKIQNIADNAIPVLWEAGDGTYELSWRGLEDAGADYYFVNVSTYALDGGNDQKTFFNGYVDGVSCSLPDLPTDETFILKIDLIKKFRTGRRAHMETSLYPTFFLHSEPCDHKFEL